MWPLKSRMITDVQEWLDIVGRFVQAAQGVEQAGWGGVQIHSAHGYLLAEYLSPLVCSVNLRRFLLTDCGIKTNSDPKPLPGVPVHIPLNLHLLYLILTGICNHTKGEFVKAIKINCSDFAQGGTLLHLTLGFRKS